MKQPPTIVVQLIHIEGPLKGQIQDFREPEITIGRHASCQVCFPKDLAIVSRQHARIVREGNRFMLMDQSTNGTFVNGKQVKEVILKDGDVLIFAEGGPKVSFLTETIPESADTAPVDMPPRAVSPEPQSPTPPSPEPAAPAAAPMPPEPAAPAAESIPPEPATPEATPIPPAPVEPVAAPVPPKPVRPAAPVSPEPSAAPRPSAEPPRVAPQAGPPQVEIPVQRVKKPLVIQYGPTLQSFNELPIIIGSGPQCDFMLDHPGIFERHAQVFYHQEQYWVKDLTGKEQVVLNGQPIAVQGTLAPESQLLLGAQGPVFRFLGGGRLAEIDLAVTQQPVAEAPPEATAEQPSKGPTKGVKEIGAMMKKMLKR